MNTLKYNEELDYLILNVDIEKEELEEIVKEADKIIEANKETLDDKRVNEEFLKAMLKKVQCLQKIGGFDESMVVIDEILKKKFDMPEALLRKGSFYFNKYKYSTERNPKDIEIVINYTTKAIDIYFKNNKKVYVYAYCLRGFSYYYKEEYENAFNDFEIAKKEMPDYAKIYLNLGWIYRFAKGKYFDYDKAICAYNKAIDIVNEKYKGKRKYKDAYYKRGIIYALKCDCKNTANCKKAANDFMIAEKNILKVLIDLKKCPSGEKIAKIMFEKNKGDLFNSVIQQCDDENKKKKYEKIYLQSLIIMSKLHVNDEITEYASHYTKKETLEKILFDYYFTENNVRENFRLNSLNTSNDPEEGKILLRYLFPQKDISSQVEKYGAFAGCFILNKDSLNQFRLYGKSANKEEGTGASISFKKTFFSDEISENKASRTEERKDNKPNLLPLFRCIYVDPETNTVVSLGQKEEYVFRRDNNIIDGKLDNDSKQKFEEYQNMIKKDLEDIDKRLKYIQKIIKDFRLNYVIVYKLMLYLRYLVKHVAFKEEQECRIYDIRDLSNECEKIQHDKKTHRLYIEYLKLDNEYVSEICFGPKEKDIEIFRQQLAHNRYNARCNISKAPFV